MQVLHRASKGASGFLEAPFFVKGTYVFVIVRTC